MFSSGRCNGIVLAEGPSRWNFLALSTPQNSVDQALFYHLVYTIRVMFLRDFFLFVYVYTSLLDTIFGSTFFVILLSCERNSREIRHYLFPLFPTKTLGAGRLLPLHE